MARGDSPERRGRRFAGGRAGVVAPQPAQAVFITGSAHAAFVHSRPAAPAENDFAKEERHGWRLAGDRVEEVEESKRSKRTGNDRGWRIEDGGSPARRRRRRQLSILHPPSSILPFCHWPGGLVKTAVEVPAVAVPLAGAVAGGALGSSVAGSGAPSASESLTTKG